MCATKVGPDSMMQYAVRSKFWHVLLRAWHWAR